LNLSTKSPHFRHLFAPTHCASKTWTSLGAEGKTLLLIVLEYQWYLWLSKDCVSIPRS